MKGKYYEKFQVLALIIIAGSSVSGGESIRLERTEPHMGTNFRIVLYAASPEIGDRAFRAAFKRIKGLNESLSDYLPNSELSQLSLTAGTGKSVPLSAELRKILLASAQISIDTAGAFDITVGPYARLWKIARAKRKLPRPDRLKLFKKSVGHTKIHLHPNDKTVELTAPGMFIDLGGIAKGFAADEVLTTLAEFGIEQALVDAGGDIVLGAPPPDRGGWKIAIGGRKHSDLPMLTLSNCAVATSGDIEQSVEIEGKTYSHIVDPRTGIGLTNRIQSTIIAPNGTTADALASATCVLGSEESRLILQKKYPNVSAYILTKSENSTELIQINSRN